jgi:hypothetical protein
MYFAVLIVILLQRMALAAPRAAELDLTRPTKSQVIVEACQHVNNETHEFDKKFFEPQDDFNCTFIIEAYDALLDKMRQSMKRVNGATKEVNPQEVKAVDALRSEYQKAVHGLFRNIQYRQKDIARGTPSEATGFVQNIRDHRRADEKFAVALKKKVPVESGYIIESVLASTQKEFVRILSTYGAAP